MENTVDAGQHIPLINRVIGQMGLRGDAADEAFSEGLVGLVEAAKSYDPTRGPLAHWLAKCIRWKIINLHNKERIHFGRPIVNKFGNPEERGYTGFKVSGAGKIDIGTAHLDIEDQQNYMQNRQELAELLVAMHEQLTELEYRILILGAMGYQGQEIAREFNLHPVAVSRAKKTARAKLEKFR